MPEAARGRDFDVDRTRGLNHPDWTVRETPRGHDDTSWVARGEEEDRTV
jgi:hypothetical protein